jgi:hypothetical protein
MGLRFPNDELKPRRKYIQVALVFDIYIFIYTYISCCTNTTARERRKNTACLVFIAFQNKPPSHSSQLVFLYSWNNVDIYTDSLALLHNIFFLFASDNSFPTACQLHQAQI